MREIKFRIFKDEKIKHIKYGHQLNFTTEGSMVCVDNMDRLPIMQFTGLTDKNGVDIYEGDIVNGFGTLLKGVISWCDDDCAFIYSSITCDAGAMLGTEYMSNFEVIGNIYENKDLLGE